MTRNTLVSDEQLGQLARKQNDLFRRVREGTLSVEQVLANIQQIIEGSFGVLMSSDVTELLVPYDEFRTIRQDRYAFLGDVKTSDVPEVEHCTHTVRFRELEFDHDPSDQKVLDKAKAENCRQPSRAEAETYIRRFSAEQLREHPRVGLIGPGVRRDGGLGRVYVVGFDLGVRLGWGWAGDRWDRGCRFVVVCKSR